MILAACLGLLGLGLLAWRRRWPFAALGLLAANLALAAPPYMMTARSPDTGAAERVTVLSINLWVSRDDDAIAALVAATDPDLVMLQEVRDTHIANLLPRLRERYPHVAQPDDVALLSRRPLSDIQSMADTADTPSIVTALWTSPAGTAFRVGSVHVAWPFPPEIQFRHVRWLTGFVSREERPLILAGDFNLTPWSYMMNRLTYASGLRRHGLLGASWPSRDAGSVPVVLIDNVLTSPQLAGRNFRVHGDVGSDHRPVSIELSAPSPSG